VSTGVPQGDVQPGTILAGKYRVERVIGQGGMGRVVEARHVALDDRVAMKFLLPEYAQHPEASARFLREARAAVKIKSEHVAKVSDVGVLETGAPYMVMEFLEGQDLSHLLERSGVLRWDDAVDYVIQASEAIAEAHSYGIVHRDIKPANMFLAKGLDGTPLVKVLDFGISKYNDGSGTDNLTKTMAAMGSALYMSPEQMQQSKTVDHRTDIYALGVSLYELLAGKQPYYAETLPQLCAEVLTGTATPLRSVRNDLPQGLPEALEKAYARDREQRYPDVARFIIALAPFAPPRTRPVIDRIARMAGLDPATASSPDLSQQARASAPPEQIRVGGYTGPASQKAAAAFAGGPGGSTGLNLARTDGQPQPASKAPLFVMLALFLAAGAAAGWFFIVRPRGAVAPAGPSAVAETAKAAPAEPPSAKPPEAKTAAPSATPADTAPTPVDTAPPGPATVAVGGGGPRPPSGGHDPRKPPPKATAHATAGAVAPPVPPKPPPNPNCADPLLCGGR